MLLKLSVVQFALQELLIRSIELCNVLPESLREKVQSFKLLVVVADKSALLLELLCNGACIFFFSEKFIVQVAPKFMQVGSLFLPEGNELIKEGCCLSLNVLGLALEAVV